MILALNIQLAQTPGLIYEIQFPLGLKLLTRLRLGLSHLNEYRFKHNSENCINVL